MSGVSFVEIKVFLHAHEFFSRLTDAQLDEVARVIVPHLCPPQTILFLENTECRGLYMVLSGAVRVFKTSPDGKEQVLIMPQAGQTFNEVPVFDGGPTAASAEAMEPSVILVLSTSDVLRFVREYPEFAFQVVRSFAKRLRHLTSVVQDLSFKNVVERVAKLILQSEDTGLHMTHQQMAAVVGTAREVVTRALRTLERDGLIELEHGHVRIVDRARLEQYR